MGGDPSFYDIDLPWVTVDNRIAPRADAFAPARSSIFGRVPGPATNKEELTALRSAYNLKAPALPGIESPRLKFLFAGVL